MSRDIFSARKMEDYKMEDYRNMERCSEPCCIFAERICADNEKGDLKWKRTQRKK